MTRRNSQLAVLVMMVVGCTIGCTACVAEAETAEVSSDLCTIEDQQSGACGESAKIVAAGDAYIADNYTDVGQETAWSCSTFGGGRWSCDRTIWLQSYTSLTVTCQQSIYLCGQQLCTQTTCTVATNVVGQSQSGSESQSGSHTDFCTAEDQEAGLCGSFKPLREFGDQDLATNYPTAREWDGWKCFTGAGGPRCTKIVQIDYANQKFECHAEQYSCSVNGQPAVCTSYYCSIGPDLTTPGEPSVQISPHDVVTMTAVGSGGSSLCTAEDQEAGLCNGPFDTAIARSQEWLSAAYPDSSSNMINCWLEPGWPPDGRISCYFEINWFGQRMSFACDVENGIATCRQLSPVSVTTRTSVPTAALTAALTSVPTSSPSFCQEGDECGGAGNADLLDDASQALYQAGAPYGIVPSKVKAGCGYNGSPYVGYCDVFASWSNHYVFIFCQSTLDPETLDVTTWCTVDIE